MRYGMAFDPERISSDDNVIDFFHELNMGIDFLMHMEPDYRLEEAYEFKKRRLVEEYKQFCRQVTMSPLIFTHYVHSYIYFCYLTHDRDALKEMVNVYLDIFQQNRIIEKHEWNKVYHGAAGCLRHDEEKGYVLRENYQEFFRIGASATKEICK